MDLTTYADGDLDKLRRDVLNEQERRRNIDTIPAEIERLTQQYNAAKGPSWPELPDAVAAFKTRNG